MTAPKKLRFNKMTVARTMGQMAEQLEKLYGFRRDRGWSQVEGRGETVNRAYGEYHACLTLLEVLGLNGVDY